MNAAAADNNQTVSDREMDKVADTVAEFLRGATFFFRRDEVRDLSEVNFLDIRVKENTKGRNRLEVMFEINEEMIAKVENLLGEAPDDDDPTFEYNMTQGAYSREANKLYYIIHNREALNAINKGVKMPNGRAPRVLKKPTAPNGWRDMAMVHDGETITLEQLLPPSVRAGFPDAVETLLQNSEASAFFKWAKNNKVRKNKSSTSRKNKKGSSSFSATAKKDEKLRKKRSRLLAQLQEIEKSLAEPRVEPHVEPRVEPFKIRRPTELEVRLDRNFPEYHSNNNNNEVAVVEDLFNNVDADPLNAFPASPVFCDEGPPASPVYVPSVIITEVQPQDEDNDVEMMVAAANVQPQVVEPQEDDDNDVEMVNADNDNTKSAKRKSPEPALSLLHHVEPPLKKAKKSNKKVRCGGVTKKNTRCKKKGFPEEGQEEWWCPTHA